MTALPEEIYRKLKKVLAPPIRVTLLTHINPDGDAIGSMLGLYWFLVKKGCQVSMAVPNDFPHFLDWMEGADQILIFSKQGAKVKEELQKADLVFCLDFNEPGRLGKMQQVLEGLDVTMILVDHHPEPEIQQFDLAIFRYQDLVLGVPLDVRPPSHGAPLKHQTHEQCQGKTT